MRPRRADAGSATILSVALMAVLALVAVMGFALVQWAHAAVRLQMAADMAALAGAASIAAACDEAARVAQANGTRLAACEIDGVDVLATVEADAPVLATRVAALLGGQASVLQRSARAGEEHVEQPDGP